MAAEDQASILADAVIGGDVKLEVSLVGVLTSLQKSVADGFGELRGSMAGKADKGDVEALRAEIRGVSGKVVGLEEWKQGLEARREVHRQRDAQERTALSTRWKVIYALIGVLISAGLLATAIAGLVAHG